MIEGMGHDLPAAAWPQLIGAIAQHAKAGDSALVASEAQRETATLRSGRGR